MNDVKYGVTHPVGIQRNHKPAHFRLRGDHGVFLYLLPVLTQVRQPQVVIHKLEPVPQVFTS